jgi:fructosamine-3-kinase
MNVMEQILNEKIDGFLTPDRLSLLSGKAVNDRVQAVGHTVLTGGCWNRVIAVHLSGNEPDLVFKINPNTNNEGIIREYRVLEYFSENTEMPVPKPYYLDTSESTIPGSVLVMEKLPGKVMHQLFSLLDGKRRQRISEEIGRYVADLHETEGRGFGGVELEAEERKNEWKDFWLPRFDKVLREVRDSGQVDTKLLDEIEEIRPSFGAALKIGNASVLTHYDIWSGNVMITFDGDQVRVSGFIDVPGFFADYARELSFMMMFGTADEVFFNIYTGRHTLDPGFLLRVNLYNLKMHLKHITMYPGEFYYRKGAESCLEYVRENLKV